MKKGAYITTTRNVGTFRQKVARKVRRAKASLMFDSHCHLDDERFDADRSDVLVRAARAGLADILLPAIRPSRMERILRVASTQGPVRLHIALGFHPQTVPGLTAGEHAALAHLPLHLRDSHAVAVGECGLDGPTGHIDQQELLFRAQIRVARDVGLPLVIHAFRAHEAVLRVLKEEQARDVGGVIHSYSGGAALVTRYLDLGFSLSFAGAVTWTRAHKPIAAAAVVPDDQLLVETDAPDQSPQSVRGQRNEPALLREVVEAVARARGQTSEHVKVVTTANARRLFRLG